MEICVFGASSEQIDNYKEYTYDKYGFLRDGDNNG